MIYTAEMTFKNIQIMKIGHKILNVDHTNMSESIFGKCKDYLGKNRYEVMKVM